MHIKFLILPTPPYMNSFSDIRALTWYLMHIRDCMCQIYQFGWHLMVVMLLILVMRLRRVNFPMKGG